MITRSSSSSCGSRESHTYSTSFPDHDASSRNTALFDSWEWRMEKDDLSQTKTGWSVEYSLLQAAILSLTSVSFLVSTSQMNRRVAMLLPAKWVLNGSQRECTEIEKSNGTCYTPCGIYITGKIMSKVLLSVWLNGSSSGKWLWFQQRFQKRHSQSIWGWSTSLIIT